MVRVTDTTKLPLAELARALRNLRGYRGVTNKAVKAAHGRWHKGGKAKDDLDQLLFAEFNTRPKFYGTRADD